MSNYYRGYGPFYAILSFVLTLIALAWVAGVLIGLFN